jgi:hypothetical protein
VALPRAVLPFINRTVPVGVPAEDDTVAVKVTDCPSAEGVSDEVRTTEVGAWLTTWLRAEDAAGENVAPPPYNAVME